MKFVGIGIVPEKNKSRQTQAETIGGRAQLDFASVTTTTKNQPKPLSFCECTTENLEHIKSQKFDLKKRK